MEAKKSDKANLENFKSIFFQIGLVFALGIVIFAFEWKSYDVEEEDVQITQVVQEVEEMVIQTKQDEPPPPPEETQQQETTEFEIVDDDVELENEFNIDNFVNTTNVDVIVPKIEVEDTEEELEEEAEIFIVVESPAQFEGGEAALNKFLAENIKYPQQARSTGTQGRVWITFVVELDGSLTDIKVLRDIGSGCGEEAIRVVKMMPKWTPAQQRGKKVRQQFNLPVDFKLIGG